MFRLYDTRTRQVGEIRPASRGLLRMYSCGPTVYRYAHLGNMRTYLLADLIRRVAARHGVTVESCQNITDVGHLADDGQPDPGGEDKILAQARAEGRSALEIARRYEDAFAADCLAAQHSPGGLHAARFGVHRADDRHDREADRHRARVRHRRRQRVFRRPVVPGLRRAVRQPPRPAAARGTAPAARPTRGSGSTRTGHCGRARRRAGS